MIRRRGRGFDRAEEQTENGRGEKWTAKHVAAVKTNDNEP